MIIMNERISHSNKYGNTKRTDPVRAAYCLRVAHKRRGRAYDLNIFRYNKELGNKSDGAANSWKKTWRNVESRTVVVWSVTFMTIFVHFQQLPVSFSLSLSLLSPLSLFLMFSRQKYFLTQIKIKN